MHLISIIIPCFNEEETVSIFYNETISAIKEMDNVAFEFIFVDDGSKDRTFQLLYELSEQDNRVKYVSFSRNFGKEAAMYAGMKKSTGDFVVIMDVDLQDPPSLLPEMYRYVIEEAYDSVATRRVSRKGEPPLRSFFARKFYQLMRRISNVDIMDGARDYRFMTRQMTNAILEMAEYNRFSKGIFCWVGFKTKWLEYENIQRSSSKTKWSFWKLFGYSLEGIVAFSTKPLAISSFAGIIFCFISFVMICFYGIKALIWGDPVAGFPTLICAIFLIGGLQLFCVGLLGQYLAKTYLETKKRPIYIVKNEN